jgi:hypothetical protein
MNNDQRFSNGESWKQLYQAALQEQNPKELERRIIDAQFAVVERLLALKYENRDSEPNLNLLENAAGVLDVLKRQSAIAEHSPVKTNSRSGKACEPVPEVASAPPRQVSTPVLAPASPPPDIVRQRHRRSTRAWLRAPWPLTLQAFRIPSFLHPRVLKCLTFWETASACVILATAVLIVGGLVYRRASLPEGSLSSHATELGQAAAFAEAREPSPAVSENPVAVPNPDPAVLAAPLAPSPEKVAPRRSPRRRSSRRDDQDFVAQDFVIYYGKRSGSAQGKIVRKSRTKEDSDPN